MSEYPTHTEEDGAPHGISVIRDLRHPAFRSSERAVLWALASRMNPKKGAITVFAAMETIAEDAGLDESAARRIMKWLVLVGVVVEVPGNYRAKSRQIDFTRLASLPPNLRRGGGVHVPVGGAHVPHAQDVSAPDHNAPGGAQNTPGGVYVLVGGCPRPPEEQEKNKRRTKEEQKTADVPSRALVSFERPLDLPFGPTITATNAAPKKGKPGPKRKFTDEQIAARDDVYKFWKKTYSAEVGVEPIVGSVEVGQMVQLLKKVDWDAVTACALITNAFGDVFFRERIKTIGNITANPSKYQTSPAFVQNRPIRMSTMQTEPGVWDRRDDELAMEHGT